MARLYGQIIDGTGWTFREVDDMTLEEVDDLFESWRERPPVSHVIRAWVGIGQRDPDEEVPDGTQELTPEQWAKMLDADRMLVEKYGRPRP